jgi:hypothetical protein
MKILCICTYSHIFTKEEIENKHKIEWVCPNCKFIWEIDCISNLTILIGETRSFELNMGRIPIR